jgi:hypothetical protein
MQSEQPNRTAREAEVAGPAILRAGSQPAFQDTTRAPTGFIPEQDQGYLITVLQLPPGVTLARTEAVVKQAIDIILKTPGVEHVAPFAGLDATTFTVASNAGTIFSGLPSLYNHSIPGIPFPAFHSRHSIPGVTAESVLPEVAVDRRWRPTRCVGAG